MSQAYKLLVECGCEGISQHELAVKMGPWLAKMFLKTYSNNLVPLQAWENLSPEQSVAT
jgi:hypothetical protein